jgi:hypothetical protein
MRTDLNYTNDELADRYAHSQKTEEELWDELRADYEGNTHWRDKPFINFLRAFYEPPIKKKNQYPTAEVDQHLRKNQLGTL